MNTIPNIVVLPVDGDLDVTTVPRLRESIDQLYAGGCRRVILNLANVGYLDTSAMALLVSESRRFHAAGGLVSLSNVNDAVYRALVIACLVDYIPVRNAGSRASIPQLDPTVRPLWRRTIRVEADDLSLARDRFSQLLGTLPFTPDEVFDMTLAVGEALGNAVEHACSTGVLLTVCAYPDRVVTEVSDCGCGYELAADEEPPETDERGRGIRLMRLLADSVDISRRGSGLGTVATLVKLVNPRCVAAMTASQAG